MTTTTTQAGDIPKLSRSEAMGLAATEYERLLELLRDLGPGDWARPTECEGWDVAAMVRHVLGAAESHGSIREQVHQMRAAKREPGPMVDGLCAVQIRERAHLGPAEIVERVERAAPRSVRARRRMPAPLRAFRIKADAPFQWGEEKWPLSYLMDVIYTRDTWMHRVDIARATDREMVVTPEHDGRIVADVVAEWARRHGQPLALTLTGPAGGNYVAGDGGERLELDAVEFCRILSGRAEGRGLLTTEVPF
jgi:uncharacterized protein (TIGR03083 family)